MTIDADKDWLDYDVWNAGVISQDLNTGVRCRRFLGVLRYGYSGGATTHVNHLIATAIPKTTASGCMFSMRFHGNNFGNTSIIDFTIVGYATNTGTLSNLKLIDEGNDGFIKYIGHNTSNFVTVVMGNTTVANTPVSYGFHLVCDLSFGWADYTHDEYSTGWTVTQTSTDIANFGLAAAPSTLARHFGYTTLAEYTDLTDGGDCTEHYHATDRLLSNLTIADKDWGGNDITNVGLLSAAHVVATSNGDGDAIKVGDDAWLGDVNVANQIVIRGSSSGLGRLQFGLGGPVIYNTSSSEIRLPTTYVTNLYVTANNSPAMGMYKYDLSTTYGHYMVANYFRFLWSQTTITMASSVSDQTTTTSVGLAEDPITIRSAMISIQCSSTGYSPSAVFITNPNGQTATAGNSVTLTIGVGRNGGAPQITYYLNMWFICTA